jgi:hypothetical protein
MLQIATYHLDNILRVLQIIPSKPKDFEWYLIDQIIISCKFSPSSKRFLSVREWPGNGLAKTRPIRSEIKSSPMPIGYNYLNIIDISLSLIYTTPMDRWDMFVLAMTD